MSEDQLGQAFASSEGCAAVIGCIRFLVGSDEGNLKGLAGRTVGGGRGRSSQTFSPLSMAVTSTLFPWLVSSESVLALAVVLKTKFAWGTESAASSTPAV